MDNDRFDRLSRLIARESSRRSILAGLGAALGSLVTWRAALAQTTPTPASCLTAGMVCTELDTCCDGYTCVGGICDCPSNAFNDDGRCAPSPPCLPPLSACAEDDLCCAGHTCVEGLCSCPSGALDALGSCESPLEPCLEPATSCAITDDCCYGFTCLDGICDCPTGLYAADGSCARATAACVGDGGSCGAGESCCPKFACQEGVCVQVAALVCRAPGGPCERDLDCCRESNAICIDGACACPTRHIFLDDLICSPDCVFPGESCDEATPCCDGAGTCEGGECVCAEGERGCGALCIDPTVRFQRDERNCGERGAACADGESCCEGACWSQAQLNESPDHCGSCCRSCHASLTCCEGVCQEPFSDVDGEPACCPAEHICAAADGAETCCSVDETCLDGVCQPVAGSCGGTVCGPDQFCYCETCVTDLAFCAVDADCCGTTCVAGFCCPVESTCLDAISGAPICCGGLHVCDATLGICVPRESAPVARPTRLPV